MKWWMPIAALGAWEAVWWAKRVNDRKVIYNTALNHARTIGKPLLVVGAPDRGATQGPGCGDICCDIGPSACPNTIQADITRGIPLPNDSAVIFVSCVLEYVDNLQAALKELHRIGRDRVYICRVQPWTVAAYLYPGAKRTLDARLLGAL